jgi:hypothetical protein
MRSARAIMSALMIRGMLAITCVASFGVGASIAHAQASSPVRVTAEVESDRVYVGQPFTLQISVEGDTRSEPPEMPALPGFRVEQRGSSQRSEIVFDGTRTVERAHRVFQYSLTANRSGVLEIPPISVRTRDGVKRTEPIRVTIEQPGELDDFKLRLETSAEEAFVGEPVTLRLTWFLGREVRTAEFSMPSLPEGFRLYAPADDGLTPAHFQSGQFFEVMFLGERSVARAGRGQLNGREFYTLTIEKTIVPSEPGEYELGPATVAFSEATRTRRSIFDSSFFDQGQSRTEVVASPAITLRVVPLPSEGRPSSFSGLVGSYSVDAKADPRDVRVGDPITLSVTVKGDGPAEEIPLLDLSGQAGFEDNFKLTGERPTVELVPGGKRFTTMIRARASDVSGVPPIELTYFDPGAREYRTAASPTIPLRVQDVQRVQLPGGASTARTSEDVGDATTTQADRSRGPREVLVEDLSAQSESALALVRGPIGVAAVAIPPAAALALVIVAGARRRARSAPDKRRRARALRDAMHALDRDDGVEGVLTGVRVFAADWTGASRDAITAEEAVERLRGADGVDDIARAVDACAAAKFGGATEGDVRAARDAVREGLRRADASLRARKGRA